MGHWRAINPGAGGSATVTSGASDVQVRTVSGPDRSDSQADSPVSRAALEYSNAAGCERPTWPLELALQWP